MSYFSSIYAADLPSRAKTVYFYLFDRADKEGYCYPAINTIARDLSISRSTVKRAIQDLEQHGYLAKTQRYRKNGGKSTLLYQVRQGGVLPFAGPWYGSW